VAFFIKRNILPHLTYFFEVQIFILVILNLIPPFIEMQHPEADVGDLIRSTAEALASDKNLLQLFVSTQQTSLNLCIEYAIKRQAAPFSFSLIHFDVKLGFC
jgi:hypothetical protein